MVDGNTGTITLDYSTGSTVIHYTSLEPITGNVTATDIDVLLPTTVVNTDVVIAEDGTDSTLTEISGTGFENTSVANPTGTLRIVYPEDGVPGEVTIYEVVRSQERSAKLPTAELPAAETAYHPGGMIDG